MGRQPTIWKQKSEDESAVVYHYTSLDAMMKIVTSGTMWATSIQYLNDSMEQAFLLNAARQRVPAFAARHRLSDPGVVTAVSERDFGNRLSISKHPFVACFSREADSLHHWKAYCPPGAGVSIGFRLRCLDDSFAVGCLKNNSAPVFPKIKQGDIRYLSDSDHNEIEYTMELAFREAATMYQHDLASGNFGLSEAFYLRLALYSAFTKHVSFRPEQEYRIMVDVYGQDDLVKLRPAKDTILPFVELSLPYSNRLPLREMVREDAHSSEVKRDCFESVIVGPTDNPELTMRAVELFLAKEKMDVRLSKSAISLRPRF